MYRAATWYILEHGIAPENVEEIARAIEAVPFVCDLENNQSRIRIGGMDPTNFLRDDRVNESVSLVSSVPRVREILVEIMRRYSVDHDVVMEGRDIGSVVFPGTPYKFYIDASPDIRLQRRAAQGQRDQIAVRDRFDSSRRASPLIIAEDAHVIDSSNLTIIDVVDEIIGQLKLKGLAL